MDPISKRISRAEEKLETLTRMSGDLRDELADIKSLNLEESAPPAPERPLPIPSRPTPPPLPETVIENNEEPVSPIRQTPPTIPAEASPSQTSLELQLGRVWFVRLGIILLTTGLVFLSRYTYDNFVRDLAPGMKLAFLYLISFSLTGAGLFCEQWKESLKNYGRIVAAGGLAAIYYCSFAAHNVTNLKVIDSPVLASLLLTASAALFSAVSVRRESRVMLATSLGLAFYSISVNPIGWMSCLSALILSILGVGMMIRYRWSSLGFVVLIGSYLSYIWWQIAVGTGGSDSSLFLPAYWLLFAGASLFATRDLDEVQHGLFSTLNNTAFFLLFSIDFRNGSLMEGLWIFCLVFGALLITMGILGRPRFPRRTSFLHLAKGVGLITLGISLKLSGYQLFVSLLIESLLLLALHLRFPNQYTRGASFVVAALSLLALHSVNPADIPPSAWLIGVFGWIGLAVLDRLAESPSNEEGFQGHGPGLLATLVSAAFLVYGFMRFWDPEIVVITFAGIGLALSLLLFFPSLKRYLHDVSWTYQTLALIAPTALITLGHQSSTFLISSALMLAFSAVHSVHVKSSSDPIMKQIHFLVATVSLAYATCCLVTAIALSNVDPGLKLVLLILIPMTGTLVARQTKELSHSIIPALTYLAIPLLFVNQSTPLFACLILSMLHLVVIHFKYTLKDQTIVRTLTYYVALFFWWTWVVVTLDSPSIVLTWTSVGVLLLSSPLGKRVADLSAIPFFLSGLLFAIIENSMSSYVAILAPLALHLWRTFKGKTGTYSLMAITSLLFLWALLTRDLGSENPAAIWAIFGTMILLTGLTLRSRPFRLIALVILAFSLGHLMIIDLINLDPLPRILSFITLGLGLLGLGFVYNRWQDRLKQIL